jgi:hypothetical protein
MPLALLSQTPFPAYPPVFQDDLLPRIDIQMPPDSLAQMLVPGNEYHWHARFIFDNGQIKDTLENTGIRIRGNTSVNAAKKSFRISINTYEPDRKWYGLEKLNLIGSHNDPVVARAKISWDMLRWMGIPAPRANHVKLYINGNYFGLYIHVEHIDEEFVQLRFGNNNGNLYKCLWPADLAYKGSNPNLYKQEYGGRRAYELVTNEAKDDYADLAHFIDVLNNTPINNLPCELEKVFDVDSYLKAMAFDILAGNWDGPIYNKNNFYLYHNLATDKFEYIPNDLDNTVGIDWLGVDWVTRNIYSWAQSGETRPIYKRLNEVPAYKDRFSFYMHHDLQTVFHPDSVFPYLDNLKALIADAAQSDPYRPLDYGFTFDDFEDGWQSSLPWFHTPTGVKSYIQGRWQSANQQLALNDISPIIHQTDLTMWPSATGIQINTSATDDNTLSGMELCYRWNGQPVTCSDLFDDGLHADGVEADGNYGNSLDFSDQTGIFEYYVQATDNTGQQSRQPICGWRVVYVGDTVAPLVINEFMAVNSVIYPDAAGEFEDWIEIYNPKNTAVSLKDFFLTDNMNQPGKWKMPNISIPSQGYAVFWADDEAEQGSHHTNFKLSAEGEYLAIFEKKGDGFTLVDSYTFGQQTPNQATGRLPNGSGNFAQALPTPGANNQPFSPVTEAGLDDYKVTISPNPAVSTIRIALKNTPDNIREVVLFDATGNVIFQKNGLSQQGYSMAPGTGLQGLYVIKVITQTGKTTWHRVVMINE